MSLNYQYAHRGYLEWFSHLMSPPESDDAESVDFLDLLEARLDGFAFASEELTEATQVFLDGEDESYRMAAIDSLLNQIEGDLAIANVVWEVIEATEDEEDDIPQILSTAIRQQDLSGILRRLAYEFPPLMSDTAKLYRPQKHSRLLHQAVTIEDSMVALRFEVDQTIHVIQSRAQSLGAWLARDIIISGKRDWSTITAAVNLLQGHEKLGDIGWGLEDQVDLMDVGLAGALRSILVNIITKVMIIIEKNDLVRYTIADWLIELRETPHAELRSEMATLIEQLYQVKGFYEILPIWLQDGRDTKAIHNLVQHIAQLSHNYDHLARQILQVRTLIGRSTLFEHELLNTVGAALEIGLLATGIFAGYDHLDEGQRTLNLTEGVKEVLIRLLPVSPQTLEQANAIQAGQIRRPSPTAAHLKDSDPIYSSAD